MPCITYLSALNILAFYRRFPTYFQASNLFRATVIPMSQVSNVCLISTVESFSLSTFIDFFDTTTRTDFCTFSFICW